MTSGSAKPQSALGFLTVLEHEQHGLVGGYLILNHLGRPLEFHCTVPVKPNRAQQILFGPTLQAYLYGEQIGQTLVSKGSTEPAVVCTDVERVLSVRDYISPPVALVLPGEDANVALETSGEKSNPTWRVDAPHRLSAGMHRFGVGLNRLAVAAGRESDSELIAQRLDALVAGFDLSEPFERIREAVEEAHKRA